MIASQASLAAGWDVISPDEGSLTDALWDQLVSHSAAGAPGLKSQASSAQSLGQSLLLRRGQLLHGADQPVRQFYILLEVRPYCKVPPFVVGNMWRSATSMLIVKGPEHSAELPGGDRSSMQAEKAVHFL